MKVFYRLKPIDDNIKATITNHHLMVKIICKENDDVLNEMKDWFISTTGGIPKGIFNWERNIQRFDIMTAVQFELEPEVATLFKLKFGDGTENGMCS